MNELTQTFCAVESTGDLGEKSGEGKRMSENCASSPQNLTVLRPGWAEHHYWRDIWVYRELFLILAWRDVAVRYKQTAIGVAWAVIRPLLTMLIFTFVFGRLAKLPSEAAPYPIMVFAGMLPWFLFATILSEGSNSLVANANLVGKVYFPRILLPASSALAALVDFGINLVILFVMMAFYGFVPSWHLIFLPVFVALAVLASLGPVFFIAALNVKYRDFRYIIPFIVQFGLYISPVGFETSVIPEKWRFYFGANPMVGVIDGFRWCILGKNNFDLARFLLSIAVITAFLWLGVAYFRRTERSFADLI
jgi:lipopolysaccharide transport system permease protein